MTKCMPTLGQQQNCRRSILAFDKDWKGFRILLFRSWEIFLWAKKCTLLIFWVSKTRLKKNGVQQTSGKNCFFHENKWYFITKIVLTYCEKKIVLVIEKNWRPRICKNFEITRTIYSNSERSEEFLGTLTFFLEISPI